MSEIHLRECIEVHTWINSISIRRVSWGQDSDITDDNVAVTKNYELKLIFLRMHQARTKQINRL